MQNWTNVEFLTPDNDKKLNWISPSGDVVKGGPYHKGLWFLPDGMYVYYQPTYWQYI